MNKLTNTQAIEHSLIVAGEHGLNYLEQKLCTKIPEHRLKVVCETLWSKGHVSGIRKEGCCERRCKFMCSSYMDLIKRWRLISTHMA